MRGLDGITNLTDMSVNKLEEIAKDRNTWHTAVIGSERVGTSQGCLSCLVPKTHPALCE